MTLGPGIQNNHGSKWKMAPWMAFFLSKQVVFHFHDDFRECTLFLCLQDRGTSRTPAPASAARHGAVGRRHGARVGAQRSSVWVAGTWTDVVERRARQTQ